MSGIAEVIGVFAARQARAGGRFAGDHPRLGSSPQTGADEREGDAGKIAAAAGAADNYVGIIAGHLQLSQGLLPDDRLVQQHMVEHTAERIFRIGVLRGDLDGLADRDPQAARRIWATDEDLSPRLGLTAGARYALGAPTFHQRFAIGLLLEAH